jgi:lipopolysaccharide export system protein LptA
MTHRKHPAGNHRFAAALAAAVAVFALSGPACAEKADRSKPINIEADRASVDDAKQLATFEGKVVLTQGTLVIRGDRMEVRQDKDGFKYGVTWGNLAYFKQKREGYDEYIEGWAERIEYDGRADQVQMFDRAYMKKAQDEVRGNYISYDANTEFFRVVGGKGKPGAAAASETRVRAVMQPKPKDPSAKPAPQPGVPLSPSGSITSPRDEPGTPAPLTQP